VSRLECLSEFVGDLDDLTDGQQLAAGDHLQGLALDVLHDDEHAAAGVTDLMDLADVWVIERRRSQGFAPQAFACDEVLFVVRIEPLDRDVPFELGIVGEKELSHSAAA
jgi:hypothetical protein